VPIVIPTAEELKRMDARSRAQWARRISAALGQLNEAYHEADNGGELRRQAHLWFQMYGPDPDAARHRAELIEALA
jgi:hypothetical protein